MRKGGKILRHLGFAAVFTFAAFDAPKARE